MRSIKIALPQEPGKPQDKTPVEVRDIHKQTLEPMIAKAGEAKADIVCFCEAALVTGIKAEADDRNVWQDVLDGPDLEWASKQATANDVNLIFPTSGYHQGKFQNVAIVLNRKGKVVGVYEKVHLNKAERDGGKICGGTWPVFELDFGKIGIMICHDMHFPEAPRILALNGAEIIFWPTHYGAIWGDDYCMALLRATAIYNGVFLASVSLAAPEGAPWEARYSLARTGVLGPRGEWRFSAGFQPGLAMGEIDLDEPLDRPWFSKGRRDDYKEMYLGDRRPETYGRLLES